MTTDIFNYDTIIHTIQQHKPGFVPAIGLILGSGLGQLANLVTDQVVIPYQTVPGFPRSSVSGHKGQLVLGTLANMPVICLQGRIHTYEGKSHADFQVFIRTLKLLGCRILLLTNAAGSLNANITEGCLSLITDHINLQAHNPLVGINDERFGERFFDMTQAYDPLLNKRFLTIAERLNIPLAEGVYLAVSGPCFETPAEIRAFRTMGADLVGMSTVPEVIVARHCGLRVAAISSVTNLAAGMRLELLSHEGTLHYANLAAEQLSRLMVGMIGSYYNDPC